VNFIDVSSFFFKEPSFNGFLGKIISLGDWFFGAFFLLGFEAGTDRTIKRLNFVCLGVFFLFEIGINKRIVTVLTDENFIRHGYIV
jgi:hypothetical protein